MLEEEGEPSCPLHILGSAVRDGLRLGGARLCGDNTSPSRGPALAGGGACRGIGSDSSRGALLDAALLRGRIGAGLIDGRGDCEGERDGSSGEVELSWRAGRRMAASKATGW